MSTSQDCLATRAKLPDYDHQFYPYPGIDKSSCYYTELDAMNDAAEHCQELRFIDTMGEIFYLQSLLTTSQYTTQNEEALLFLESLSGGDDDQGDGILYCLGHRVMSLWQNGIVNDELGQMLDDEFEELTEVYVKAVGSVVSLRSQRLARDISQLK